MHKKLGFGFMRLPMNGTEIDIPQTCQMVDRFLEQGFRYFDVARGYLDCRAESAIRQCLTSRYPRERFILTDKLSGNFFQTQADIRPLFEKQLTDCGVEYFDLYLMHAQSKENYPKYQAAHAYETALELKKEGKIRHLGISFHDTPAFLDRILTDHPEVEAVQLQFNYLDYNSAAVQSKGCYEVCRKHGKPVLVMEPVKGGRLVDLPETAAKILDGLNGGSYASYAIRFAAGFEGIEMVLSGMSSLAQLEDNTSFMADFRPLDPRETEALEKVCAVFAGKHLIPCTACRYCEGGCPRHIHIPDLFSVMNGRALYDDWNGEYYYGIHTNDGGKAADCVGCGQCEEICPQHLPVRELLKKVSEVFDK